MGRDKNKKSKRKGFSSESFNAFDIPTFATQQAVINPTEQLQVELKEVHNKNDKLVYYVIALCATCIGFSVLRTQDQLVTVYHIPVALAILFWLLSMHFGFLTIASYTAYHTQGLYFWSAASGIYPESGKPIPLGVDTSGLIEDARAKSKMFIDKAYKRFRYQKVTFYAGVICFIIWHSIDMIDPLSIKVVEVLNL